MARSDTLSTPKSTSPLPSTPFDDKHDSVDRAALHAVSTLLTIASGFVVSISVAAADDQALITQLAEFEKTQGLVTGYMANKEDYHLDVTISPTTPLPKVEAGLAGHTTCSLGTRELATK